MIERAANSLPENVEDHNERELEEFAAERLISAAIFEILAFCQQTKRMKKPFNSILGETYEFVDEKYRCFAE